MFPYLDRPVGDQFDEFEKFRYEMLEEANVIAQDTSLFPIFHNERLSFEDETEQRQLTSFAPAIPDFTPHYDSQHTCCLAQSVNNEWIRCSRATSTREMTKTLHKIAILKKLPIAIDANAKNNFICLFHWRVIKYSAKGRGLRPIDYFTYEGQETLLEQMETDNDESSSDSSDGEEEITEVINENGQVEKKTKPTEQAYASDTSSEISSLASDFSSFSEASDEDMSDSSASTCSEDSMAVDDDDSSGSEDDHDDDPVDVDHVIEVVSSGESDDGSSVMSTDGEDSSEDGDADDASDDNVTNGIGEVEEEVTTLSDKDNEEEDVDDEDEEDDDDDGNSIDSDLDSIFSDRSDVKEVTLNNLDEFGCELPIDWRLESPKSNNGDTSDDNEEEEHVVQPNVEKNNGLSSLPAAVLRKYRKHYKIPTKASDNKHTMLEGVRKHFENMPVDSRTSIVAFLHAIRCPEEETIE